MSSANTPPSPTDPSTWHPDTRDVFLIVGSKLKTEPTRMEFLESIRPFERARISSGLRDLLHMDIIDTSVDAGGHVVAAPGANFAAASSAQDIPRTVNISHLQTPKKTR
mmetsp:Transcript_2453/g.7079  ORF Transcript_2453/g.7079 Transcript_2453/m.7079 type:complete len:109 (-) Transcript_2453:74-400(-)